MMHEYEQFSVIQIMWNKFSQIIKFGIVGVSNTVISLAVYYICLQLYMHYLVAYVISFLASVSNAFFWNSRYVFKNRRENSLIRAYIKTVASYGVSFFISIGLMSIMIEGLNISAYLAPILKQVVTIPINFALNKIWAFKDKE